VPSRSFAFGPFIVDHESRVLFRDGQPIPLSPKAFDTLWLLIEAGGRLLTKEELMKALWPETFVLEANLSQTIFTIRKALGESASEQRYIATVPGRGYRFAAAVKEVSPTELASPAAATSDGTDDAARPTSSRQRRWPNGSALAAAALVAGIVSGFVWWTLAAAPSRPSNGRWMLAVLPFENLTGDAGQEYFSDGLTEEMITRLGRLDPQRLGVIGRASVMRYKGRTLDLDQIGRELEVGYVLEGSVRRASGKVRIAAQLIQLKDQTQIWARQYDRDQQDLLAIHAEIAQQIAEGIQITLGGPRPAVRTLAPLSDQAYEAYDLYLKGRYFWNKRTGESLRLAVDYFQRATEKDPGDARAYAGLADAYALLSGYTGRPQTEFMPQARSAALKAIELDETLPEAHTALALVLQKYDWDWQGAEQHFRRAIELDPNYATAHHWYAEQLSFCGRFEEALRESERAHRLDPLSLIIAADDGTILYYSRRYDRAIQEFRSVMEMEPSFPRAHNVLKAYVQEGRYADALADLDAVGSVTDPLTWLTYAYIYGRSGQMRQAHHALMRFQEFSRGQRIDPGLLAWAHIGMGNKDAAIASLEKAYSQHSDTMVTLRVEPAFDLLRSDPRFQDLQRRVGLDR
jgi:TolB-like protein/DNA-binding winged helix-turn-helix (wHTH) protein/Tfp pilus assembly protein PilF